MVQFRLPQLKIICRWKALAALLWCVGVGPAFALDSPSSIVITPSLGHTAIISALDISTDARWIVSASVDNTVKVWDSKNKRLVRTLTGHASQVMSVSLSPDGRWIASGGLDKTIKIWDFQSGALIRTLNTVDGVASLAFSPDGDRVAAGQSGKIQVWQRETGSLIRTLQRTYIFLAGRPPLPSFESVKSLVYKENGRLLTSVYGDGTFIVWDGGTGRTLRTTKFAAKGHVVASALAADGKTALIANYEDYSVKVVSVEDARLLRRYENHSSEIVALSFSPRDQMVASAETSNRVRIWNSSSGQTVHSIDRYQSIGSLIFSRDGGRLIFGGYPLDASGSVSDGSALAIFDVRSNAPPEKITDKVLALSQVVFHPDGRRYVSFGDTIRIWGADTAQLDQLFQMPEGTSQGAISPDGRLLATIGGSSIYILEIDPLRIVRKIETVGKGQRDVVFSTDSQRVASVTYLTDDPITSAVNTWEVATGKHLFKLADQSDHQSAIAYSADGTRMATASEENKIWNAQSGALLKRIRVDKILSTRSLAFSPDSKQLAGDTPDRKIKIWNAQSGEVNLTLTGHQFDVQSIAYDKAGQILASSDYSGIIRLWNARSGTAIGALRGHTSTPSYLSFSPIDRKLVSSSDDNTVRIWNSQSGDLLATTIAGKGGDWVTITPEGFFTSSPKIGDLLHLVRGLEVYSIDQVYQALYRPDLVREKLAGDPKGLVREAAAKLDLSKVMASGGAPQGVDRDAAGHRRQ